MMILKQATLPKDIMTLGDAKINQIWRDAKLRAVGIKRAKTLIEAAEHNIGSQEGLTSAQMEIAILLEDYEAKSAGLEKVVDLLEELCRQIPMVEKLLKIKGMKTVSGFLAEVGDIRRFDNPKQLQKLAGLALVEDSSESIKGKQGSAGEAGRD